MSKRNFDLDTRASFASIHDLGSFHRHAETCRLNARFVVSMHTRHGCQASQAVIRK